MADESHEEAEDAVGAMVTVTVSAMLCRRCVRLVSRHVRDVPGVVSFEVDAARGLLRVRGGMAAGHLVEALRSAGFRSARCGHREHGQDDPDRLAPASGP
ncbi:heavy-metal-associated domain-containing protein [Planomonospora algeriensis]